MWNVVGLIFVNAIQLLYEKYLINLNSIYESPLQDNFLFQVEKYPDFLSSLVEECNSALETAIDKKLEVLTKEKEKPKILKLYEPKIVPV